MFDRIDTGGLPERRGKGIVMTPDYNPASHYEASHISIRQELLEGHGKVCSRPRANTLHQSPSNQQTNKHKIRVGRGRLPEDFFTKVDLLRINTVESNLKRKGDYASLETPTFASRAQKVKEQRRLFVDPQGESEQLPYNERETMQQPVIKKTANFFNGGDSVTGPAREGWQSKALERKLKDKLEVQQVHSSRTSGREPVSSRTMLEVQTGSGNPRKEDSCSTTANTTLVMKESLKNQSAEQPQRPKRKQSKRMLNLIEGGPLIFDTTVLRKDLQDFTYKRKFKQSAILREELFEVPALRFPQSDKSQQTVLRSLKSSMLPPLK